MSYLQSMKKAISVGVLSSVACFVCASGFSAYANEKEADSCDEELVLTLDEGLDEQSQEAQDDSITDTETTQTETQDEN